MKYKLFSLFCLAVLSLLFVVVGVLALLGYANAEISFWSRRAIESEAGKITWIVISATGLVVFSALAVSGYRKLKD
jgi:hypothetical protein